jgi:hypothetical protein
MRLASMKRLVIVFGLAAALLSCKTKDTGSDLNESAAGTYAMQIRVFSKLIGRSPSLEELKLMKGMSLDQTVDHIMASKAYQQEGFLYLHNDRLLLNRQGDENWVRDSSFDYCSFKWELAEAAKADLDGEGYWDLLRNRVKWLPLEVRNFSSSADEAAGIAAIQKSIIKTTSAPDSVFKRIDSKFQVRHILDLETCSYETLDWSQAKALSRKDIVYASMELDAKFSGIHGHPYYLNRHASSAKNRQLHRGRLMLYSYFCSDISPDEANMTGGAPQLIPQHQDYFQEKDQHAEKSANCYSCHLKVQPMGNFFGGTSIGEPYGTAGPSDEAIFVPPSIGADGASFDKLGGYYDGREFFPVEGTARGLEGLANLLSQHPSVRSCLVNTMWAKLIGRDYELTEKERKAAIQSFSSSGKERLSSLIKQLIVSNERGQVYFTRGEATFAKIKVDNSVDCEAAENRSTEAAAEQRIAATCTASCHTRPFSDSSGKISTDLYFGNNPKDPEKIGALWNNLYCQVKLGLMPPKGAVTLADKNIIQCHFENSLKAMAKANTIPARYSEPLCNNLVPELKAGDGHSNIK